MQNSLEKERNFTILLVDDIKDNITALQCILKKENRTFLKAFSGSEAIEIINNHPEIGLIMLDIQMPEMDGYQVAEILKSNPKTKDISIIFVTAINRDEDYVLKGFAHGAVDYLQKPLNMNVTRAKVNVFERLYFYQHDLRHIIEQKEIINKQLERFTYVVAHDLKSPLTGIIGLLQLIEADKRMEAAEDLSKYLSITLNAAKHLSFMISTLLQNSKLNNVEQAIEPVDVHDLVTEIARLLFPPPHISIQIDGHLPVINTRKIQLMQVFQNLISNAIKYNDKENGAINIGYIDDGEFYKFYVKDNGPGVADKDKERIFHLFETTDNQSHNTLDNSTGVGLNILKVLVEGQGGIIEVSSIPNEGSTFYFQWAKGL